MTTWILHNRHDAQSRAFVVAHGAGAVVIDWYGDDAISAAARAQYIAGGNPHPSAFPSVVRAGVIVRLPADLATAEAAIDAALAPPAEDPPE